jgi:hypothetical protein
MLELVVLHFEEDTDARCMKCVQERSARTEFIYFNDDGDLVALRHEN